MKRHALFVGVNDYSDEAFRNLRYSLSDAVALSGAFAARGFEVEVLSNPKADAVLGTVERKAAGLGRGDVFLFFFAGHGFTAPDGSHLLICSGDRLAYLRHNRAGIPVDLLEDVTNGRGCNRAFLLDACRTDVFAGVENRGAETRDLALVSLPDAKVHAGTCCVLRSCDRFCPAMEFDDLGHGVFTRAVMDMLSDESACATPFGEAFVAGIRSRMRGILSAHNVPSDQNPCFQTNGEAFFLFDGVASASSMPPPSYHHPAPALVVCPVCGKKNRPEDTFKCRECGRDNLCLRHQEQEEKTFFCDNCFSKQAESWFKKGEDFFNGNNGCRKDHDEAVKWYRKAADRGFAAAQDKLGWMYENGWGTCKDYAQAAEWYRKAAEQGNDLAQSSLGRMYENGWGVPQSNEKAVEWYRKAADKGNKDACHKYGDILFLGLLGVAKNVTAAFTYFKKADLSEPWIQYDIGECHRIFYTEKGNDEKDAKAAVEWLQKSATAGVPWACVKMGDCYRDGIGVTKDLGRARDWYNRALDPAGIGKFGDQGAADWAKRGLADLPGEA